jgi:Bacterial regulatory protein, Fis family
MPFVPLRPPALAHLSDEAASIVLAKHFGDVVKAAKELGVDRRALRRLTWHNPRILTAPH